MKVDFQTHANEFRLKTEILLPRPINEVFGFFADARNLEVLTPEFLNFSIISKGEIFMETGTVIDYCIRLKGFPLYWKTLISHWQPPYNFVDEQLKGPYRYWIHSHTFEERGESTLVKDYVRYQVYGGKLVHGLLVKKDLEKIFNFRQNKLQEIICS